MDILTGVFENGLYDIQIILDEKTQKSNFPLSANFFRKKTHNRNASRQYPRLTGHQSNAEFNDTSQQEQNRLIDSEGLVKRQGIISSSP